MDLDGVKLEAARYPSIAYLATASVAGEPHVVPVAVAWVGDDVCAFVLATSKKIANVRANPRAAVHYPVSEANDWDSLLVQGSASVVDTVEGRRGLWDTMGYDLAAFEPGGPESDNHVFLRITPERAIVLRMYGIKGRETWTA